MKIDSSEYYQPVFKMGNYSHIVPIGYTYKTVSARGVDWVVLKKDGKDIVSISERPMPIRACKYRVYLHSYPNRRIQLADYQDLFEMYLSAQSNSTLVKNNVTQYIFGTDNLNDYSELIDLFFENE